jgi:hypothetical protein
MRRGTNEGIAASLFVQLFFFFGDRSTENGKTSISFILALFGI